MRKRLITTLGGPILVRESEGKGRPMLLIHGNSFCSESFGPQIEGEPGKKHRMVAFDLPGHGGSFRAQNPGQAYTLEAMRRTVGEVADKLGIEAPILVGHSLGGHLALQAVAGGFRASGVFVFGTPPLESLGSLPRAFLPHPVMATIFQGALTDRQIEERVSSITRDRGKIFEMVRSSLRDTDPEARAVFGASLGNGFDDEVGTLRRAVFPKAVAIGENDPLVNPDYIRSLALPGLWGGELLLFSGAAHSPQLETPQAFNRALLDFAAAVDKAAA